MKLLKKNNNLEILKIIHQSDESNEELNLIYLPLLVNN